MLIDVCLCTFRRSFVTETLRSVEAALCPQGAEIRVIVIDNDNTPSARGMVLAQAAVMARPVRYLHVPGANISIARNAGLVAATADWIAFIDDDEVAEPGWLLALVARQQETGADAVFGPSRAIYGPEAPGWMVSGDFHSQVAVARGGQVETGHTCNALLRWRDAVWRDQRFAVERGRTGGEDTEFFFRLHRMGARYALAEDAVVRETVPPARQHLSWLLHRRFRIGQSHAASAVSPPARLRLFGLAAVKSAYCLLRAGLALANAERQAFWLLRATLHGGVCAGCLHLPEAALYGGPSR